MEIEEHSMELHVGSASLGGFPASKLATKGNLEYPVTLGEIPLRSKEKHQQSGDQYVSSCYSRDPAGGRKGAVILLPRQRRPNCLR